MAEASFEEMLNKITSDPSIMAKISEIAKEGKSESIADKLPDVIAAISPSINDSKTEEKTDTSLEKAEKSELNTGGALPLSINKISEKISKNSKLLIALKPYLSKERGDIVDSIVKMAQVADLMKAVK